MESTGIALLGSRFMGKAHSNAWTQVSHFFDVPTAPGLRTIAATDPIYLEAFAARWGWARWTTDWVEAITAEDVDLVDIATPNYLHADQAIAALEAGKHVACEKPLAGTLRDAEQMVDAAARSGRHTFVWYNYRRVPAVALARQLVFGGTAGADLSRTSRLPAELGRTGYAVRLAILRKAFRNGSSRRPKRSHR